MLLTMFYIELHYINLQHFSLTIYVMSWISSMVEIDYSAFMIRLQQCSCIERKRVSADTWRELVNQQGPDQSISPAVRLYAAPNVLCTPHPHCKTLHRSSYKSNISMDSLVNIFN